MTSIPRHRIILTIILLVGAILRFYNYSVFSLSNDELSALSRLDYSSFSELLEKGIKIDGHPAFVQTFLFYWVKVFGNSVAAVRFPFIVAGILLLLFAYLFASRWFNRTTGLFTAALLASLSFPILFSQLARMYSFGLLFSMMTVYFWTQLLFEEKRLNDFEKRIPYWLRIVLLAVSASLCMYTHYFSFLFALMVGGTGLFFMNKSNYKFYLDALVMTTLLFLPYFSTFLYQLSLGGVGQWLGKPGDNWLLKHIFYVFNESYFVIALVLIVVLFFIIRQKSKIQFTKFQWLCIAWFLIPYIIGSLYSTYINPVLQNSVLLFSFPFFPLFFFSFIKEELKGIALYAFIIFFAGITASTVIEKKYYTTQHFGVFKELAEKTIEWETKYGKLNITKTISVNHPFYIQYYFEKFNRPDISFSQYSYSSENDLKTLRTILDTCHTPYFIYGWSNCNNPPEVEQMILIKYPYKAAAEKYFNSGITLYTQNSTENIDTAKPVFSILYDFSSLADSTSQISSHYEPDSLFQQFNETLEYGQTYEVSLAELKSKNVTKIRIRLWTKLSMDNSNLQYVTVLDNPKGYNDWHSTLFRNFASPGKWQQVTATYLIPENAPDDATFKAYPWNPGKENAEIDAVLIEFFK